MQTTPADNLILIGMPGSGKSTTGVILAKRTARGFVDTDVLIQTVEGRTLQEIIDAEGYLALREIEQRVLLELEVSNHVIATGGSAVYSEAGMRHLKRDGLAVFLEVDLPTLEERIGDFSDRGIAMQAGQTFASLFAERVPLYRRFADLTIACAGLTPEAVCARLEAELQALKA